MIRPQSMTGDKIKTSVLPQLWDIDIPAASWGKQLQNWFSIDLISNEMFALLHRRIGQQSFACRAKVGGQ